MDKNYATQAVGCAGNPCSPTEAEPQSPVSLAISNLRNEISEVHYHADSLIHSIAPALRAIAPANDETEGRPAMASDLAEEIQYLADVLRAARAKLADARERVTL
jgi:hypothetical protein